MTPFRLGSGSTTGRASRVTPGEGRTAVPGGGPGPGPRPVLSVVRCAAYEPGPLAAAIDRLVEPFGGFDALVRPGMTVFLKPNLLSAKNPDSAAVTHPAVLEAVAAACRGRGARVVIGDSPPLTLKRIEDFWEKTGYREAAARTGSTLLALEQEPSREIVLDGPRGPLSVRITDWYWRAGLVINLAKFKSHNLTVLTGAVKNHFGLVPGLLKAQMHLRLPRAADFGAMIADLAAAVPMHLHVLDGIHGMDGEGPAGGRPIPIGCLLAARDPVSVDLGMSAIAGVDPDDQPILRHCRAKGFGPADLAAVEVRGVPLADLRVAGFRAPAVPLLYRVPEPLFRVLRRFVWARPRLVPDRCIRCGACVRVCASRAVRRPEGQGIRFRHARCISCFCCMEVCPKEAIVMQSSPLVDLALRLREWRRWWKGGKP